MATTGLKFNISAFDKTGKAFKSVNRNLGIMRRSIGNLKFVMAGVAGGLMVKSLIDASVAMEKMTLGLRGATGNATLGAREFEYLKTTVKELSLDLESSGEAFTLLTAASRGTALQGQDTRDIFEAIAASSMVMGRSADDTAGSLYAIQQMISKGKVTSEELRRQLGDRLPGAFKLAARAMDMTESGLDAAMRKGEVYATDFLPKFSKALKDEYGEALPAAMQTTQAGFNRLTTAMFEARSQMAGSGLIEVVKEVVDGLTELAGSDSVTEMINDFGKAVKENKENIIATVELIGKVAIAVGELASITISSGGDIISFLRDLGGISSFVFGGADARAMTTAIQMSGVALADTEKAWKNASDTQREYWKLQVEINKLAFDNNPLYTQTLRVLNEKQGKLQAILDLEKRIAEGTESGEKPTRMGGAAALADAEALHKRTEAEKLAKKQKDFLDSKEYKNFLVRLGGKTAAIEASYEKELAIAVQGHAKGTAVYIEQEKIIDKVRKEAYAKLEAYKRQEYDSLVESQLSEREIIQKTYDDKIALIKNTKGVLEADKEAQRGRALALYNEEVEAFRAKEQKKTDIALEKAMERAEKQHLIDIQGTSAEVYEGMSKGLLDYAKNAGTVYDGIADASESAFQGMEDAMVSFMTTGKADFSEFANSIIADIMRILVRQQMIAGINAIMGSMDDGEGAPTDGLGGFADGGAFNRSGLIKAFASGGIVDQPTYFGYGNGKTGLLGEAGAEAILPLTRINGKLGVQAQGGGGSTNVSVNQTFDLRGADESTVPKLTAAAQQIKQETLAAVRSSLSRGGELHRLTRG